MASNENGTIVIDTPAGIRMAWLLTCRMRLHLEMDTGMTSRMSTLRALQRGGITVKRTRKGALDDLNKEIKRLNGPEDSHAAKRAARDA